MSTVQADTPAPQGSDQAQQPPVDVVPPAPAPAQTGPAQAPVVQTPPATPAKGETPATVLDILEVDGILGKEVRSSTGENMGRIVDIIVNRSSQVRAAIIDFGGFLGVGSRKIAVDWTALHFASDGKLDRIILGLTRNEVRVAPEYKPGEQVVVLGPPQTAPLTAASPPSAPEK